MYNEQSLTLYKLISRPIQYNFNIISNNKFICTKASFPIKELILSVFSLLSLLYCLLFFQYILRIAKKREERKSVHKQVYLLFMKQCYKLQPLLFLLLRIAKHTVYVYRSCSVYRNEFLWVSIL